MDGHVPELVANISKMIADFKANDQQFLDLAFSLHKFNTIDPAARRNVCMQMGLKLRKSDYLVSIGRVFSPYPDLRQRLAKVGWAKLAVVATRVNSVNIMKVIELAENSTEIQLKAMRKGPLKDKPCVVTLKFSKSQYELFGTAVTSKGAKQTKTGFEGAEQIVIEALQNLPV